MVVGTGKLNEMKFHCVSTSACIFMQWPLWLMIVLFNTFMSQVKLKSAGFVTKYAVVWLSRIFFCKLLQIHIWSSASFQTCPQKLDGHESLRPYGHAISPICHWLSSEAAFPTCARSNVIVACLLKKNIYPPRKRGFLVNRRLHSKDEK